MSATAFVGRVFHNLPDFDGAACADIDDPDAYFPGQGQSPRLGALALCVPCPVRARCLAEGMTATDKHQFGYFGGLSAASRRALKKQGWRPGDELPPVGWLPADADAQTANGWGRANNATPK